MVNVEANHPQENGPCSHSLWGTAHEYKSRKAQDDLRDFEFRSDAKSRALLLSNSYALQYTLEIPLDDHQPNSVQVVMMRMPQSLMPIG